MGGYPCRPTTHARPRSGDQGPPGVLPASSKLITSGSSTKPGSAAGFGALGNSPDAPNQSSFPDGAALPGDETADQTNADSMLRDQGDPAADRSRSPWCSSGYQAVAYCSAMIHLTSPSNVMVGAFGVQVMDVGGPGEGTGRLRVARSPAARRIRRRAWPQIRSARDASGSKPNRERSWGLRLTWPSASCRPLIDQVDERSDVFGLGVIHSGDPDQTATVRRRLLALRGDAGDGCRKVDDCFRRLGSSGAEPN